MSSNWTDSRLTFAASNSSGEVSALLRRPAESRLLYVLAHGAGAGMQHPFMEEISRALASRGVATFRYQFPYMEAGRRAPNPRPILLATVRSAVAAAAKAAPDLPMIAGGKSMGGRMTSLAASERPLPGVVGLVFLGFPLHAAGRPSSDRGHHLKSTGLPMLFLQGTRDRLAELTVLKPLIAELGKGSTLHIIDEGDHSFRVPKRTGLTEEDVLDGAAATIVRWAEALPI
jgi:uncharacterized protein